MTSLPPTIDDLTRGNDLSVSSPKEITIEAFNYNGLTPSLPTISNGDTATTATVRDPPLEEDNPAPSS